MLDVIVSRGLPLDRITTTDVWATDTISANLPPVEDFKARMDEKIWQLYRIDVEHLCARNPDGSKRTYEQMFYHVPQRRLQNIQVERESRFGSDDPRGFPMNGVPWCQPLLKKPPTPPPAMESAGNHYRIPAEHAVQLVSETQASRDSLLQRELHGVRISSSECRPQGYPAQISPWCRKLKIDKVKTPF